MTASFEMNEGKPEKTGIIVYYCCTAVYTSCGVSFSASILGAIFVEESIFSVFQKRSTRFNIYSAVHTFSQPVMRNTNTHTALLLYNNYYLLAYGACNGDVCTYTHTPGFETGLGGARVAYL